MMPKLINKNRRDDNNNPDEKKKKPLIERKGDWLCPKCRNLIVFLGIFHIYNDLKKIIIFILHCFI